MLIFFKIFRMNCNKAEVPYVQPWLKHHVSHPDLLNTLREEVVKFHPPTQSQPLSKMMSYEPTTKGQRGGLQHPMVLQLSTLRGIR